MHCKILDPGVSEGTGQSLVGLLLSDKDCEAGFGHKPTGRIGSGERRRKKRGAGAGRATMLWLSLLSGPCIAGVPGRGVGGGRKDNSSEWEQRPSSTSTQTSGGSRIPFAGLGWTGPLGLPGRPYSPWGLGTGCLPMTLHAPCLGVREPVHAPEAEALVC